MVASKTTDGAQESSINWREWRGDPHQIPNDPYGDCPGCFILDSIIHTTVDTLNYKAYSYDLVHNRTDGGATVTTGNRMTGMDGWTITYDDAGFIRKRKKGADSLAYTWNALGQLTKVVAPGYTVTYGYDAFGNRVRKSVNGDSTHYIVEDGAVLVELSDSWQPVAKYTYYPGVDQPHSMVRDGKRYYFLQDAQGNVTGVADSGGVLKNTYHYSPYGEALSGTSETVANPYRFKGREWDAEARLYFMRARYYDPQIGRFVSDDPIGLEGGINPTAFVGGEPVNRADPSGLLCQLAWDIHSWTSTGEVFFVGNFRFEGSCGHLFAEGGAPGYSLGSRFGGWWHGLLEEEKRAASVASVEQSSEGQASAARQPTRMQCREAGMAAFRGLWVAHALGGTGVAGAGKGASYFSEAIKERAAGSLRKARTLLREPGQYVSFKDLARTTQTMSRAASWARAGIATARAGVVVGGFAIGFAIGVDAMCMYDVNYYS